MRNLCSKITRSLEKVLTILTYSSDLTWIYGKPQILSICGRKKPKTLFTIMFAQLIVLLAVLAISLAYDRNELVLQDNIPDVIKTKQRK